MPTVQSRPDGRHHDLAHLTDEKGFRDWKFRLQAWLINRGQEDFLSTAR
jgi:hypothetical protein